MKNKPTYWINSVDHALRLAIILHVEGPLTVAGAADRLGVARSTAHRLLSMLVYRDFAVQDEHRVYQAGPLLSLGPTSLAHTASLRAIALPHLTRLADELRESTQLQILTGSHVRFVATVEAARLPRVGNREGMVHPAYLSSAGKSLLAELDAEHFDCAYRDSEQLGRKDLPSRAKLAAELAGIRARGFALNLEESEDGLVAVGRALRWNGGTSAGISVSMPSSRYDESQLRVYVRAITATAHALERELIEAIGP